MVDETPKPEVDEVIVSERAGSLDNAVGLSKVLRDMGDIYRRDPEQAVRGQQFIKQLHTYIGSQLEARLTRFAVRGRLKSRKSVRYMIYSGYDTKSI